MVAGPDASGLERGGDRLCVFVESTPRTVSGSLTAVEPTSVNPPGAPADRSTREEDGQHGPFDL